MFAQAEESKLSIGAGGLQLQNASLLDAKLSAERTAAELSSQVTYLTHSLTTDRPSGANALFVAHHIAMISYTVVFLHIHRS